MAMFRFHWRVAYDPSTSAPVADGVPVVIYAAATGGSPLQAYSSVGTPISPTTQGGLTPEFYLDDRTDCFVDAGSDRFYVTADSFPVEARDAALAAATTVAGYESRLAAVEAGGATSLTAGSVTTIKLADGAVTDPKVSTISIDKIVDSPTRVAMLPSERAKLTSLTNAPAAPVYTTGIYAARPNADLSWPTPTVSDVTRAAIDAAGQTVWWMKPAGAAVPTYANGLRQGDIVFPAAPIAGPTASFTATRVGSTRQFNFDASASAPTAPATIASYAWDFGDTGTGSGVTTSHTYTTDTVRTVTLTVTDSNSLTATATTTVAPSFVNTLFSDSFTGADNTLLTVRDTDQYAGGTTTTRPTLNGTAGYAKIASNRCRVQAAGGVRWPSTVTFVDVRAVVKSWAAGLVFAPVDWDSNNFVAWQVTAAAEFKTQTKTTSGGYLLSGVLTTIQADDEIRVVWDATLPNQTSSAFGGYRFQVWRGGALFYEATTPAAQNGTYPVGTNQAGPRVGTIATSGTSASEIEDLRFVQTIDSITVAWKSGASGPYAANGTFGTWRGRALPIAGTWSDISFEAQAALWQFDTGGEYDAWTGDIDLACGAWWDSSWSAAAGGAHDAAWATFFTNARAKWYNKARGTMYIRFAHEWNGNWAGEPWFVTSAGQVTDFRAAWHRFRLKQQLHFPESKLVCCTNGDGRTYAAGPIGGVATMLPNAEDYDVYASDIYQGHFNQNANVFEEHKAIATAAGKPFAIGEWGLHLAAGGDASSVAYLNKINAFGHAGNLLYDCYFNINYTGNDQFSVYPATSMPTGAARYQSLVWGSA